MLLRATMLCLLAVAGSSAGAPPQGAAAVAAAAPARWDWSRTRTWMEVSNYAPMTDAEARFAATHYDIIGIGGTFGSEPHHGEAAQAAAAKQLKLHNANVTVLIYRNSNLVIDGQLQSDLVFDAHPEWLLRNASGAPVYNSPSQPFINFTDPAAREWWVSSCVRAITQQPNGSAIDGVWIDGAGDFEAAVQASGVTGVTHPCTTGPLTPAPSPRSPLHARCHSARASVQCPDCPRGN
jgi:hypothetical protein